MSTHRWNPVNLRSAVLVVTLALLSGCAATGDTYDTGESGWNKKQLTAKPTSSNKAPIEDIEGQFRRGTSAYRAGDLDKAERHFRAVLQSDFRHSRATYNLSMIYLQRAYEGLEHYARIEPEKTRSDRARSLVKQLDTLRASK